MLFGIITKSLPDMFYQLLYLVNFIVTDNV